MPMKRPGQRMKGSQRIEGNGQQGQAALDARLTGQRGRPMQPYGRIRSLPIGLAERVRTSSINALNQMLADTIMLRELYKKNHWQVAGPTFYSLHLLFDKHYEEQVVLADALAERVQMLGGVSLAAPHDVVQVTHIERPPRDAEEVPVQLSRLLEAHEVILEGAHNAAHRADDEGDDGTADLLISQVIRTNELQVWFVGAHLAEVPLLHPEQPAQQYGAELGPRGRRGRVEA
ncbi:MAG: Dps family protein [Myxococcaceae bacterium]